MRTGRGRELLSDLAGDDAIHEPMPSSQLEHPRGEGSRGPSNKAHDHNRQESTSQDVVEVVHADDYAADGDEGCEQESEQPPTGCRDQDRHGDGSGDRRVVARPGPVRGIGADREGLVGEVAAGPDLRDRHLEELARKIGGDHTETGGDPASKVPHAVSTSHETPQ